MKKLLFFLPFICLMACENLSVNPSKTNDISEKTDVIWMDSKGDSTSSVKVSDSSEEGLKIRSVNYLNEATDGSGTAFGIIRITSETSVLYKGLIQLKNTSAPFADDYIDSYTIDAGSEIQMQNAVSSADTRNGYNVFSVIGSLTSLKVEQLKNANSIKIKLRKTPSETEIEQAISDYISKNTSAENMLDSQIQSLKNQYSLGLITRTEYEERLQNYTEQKDKKISDAKEVYESIIAGTNNTTFYVDYEFILALIKYL